jgi:hypothetical protein
MRTGWVELPTQIAALSALANPWVLGAALLGLIAEFFADKVAWLDSLWDTVHTVVRPIGGALLALAVVDASDPAWQALAFLLGGGAALVSHGAKASARAVVNASPEPVSNIVVSSAEDVATGSMLALALANPVGAVIVAVAALAFAVMLLIYARRALRSLIGFRDRLVPREKG